ncbi:hypothetical protein RchiOBHm_Chr2g0133981 [Rosa chinensis]|uniref:Uncharacterized protein n=1 Tax=Rosa chinensis TaxID=74649 RepID=A0A2P6RVP9_ROSCH|nr:hypothetical protein RchiOBHm_Chr2g0133981 [Rosa chinensis]
MENLRIGLWRLICQSWFSQMVIHAQEFKKKTSSYVMLGCRMASISMVTVLRRLGYVKCLFECSVLV